MEISPELYDWISQFLYLQAEESDQGIKLLQIDQFLTGQYVNELVDDIIMRQNQKIKQYQELQIDEGNNPSQKLRNWNIIIKKLQDVNVLVNSDEKALIVSGDLQVLQKILRRLMKVDQMSKQSETGKESNSVKLGPDGSIYIESINIQKELEETEYCLEFIIIALCKSLGLTLNQAAGVLTQEGKFLAHLLVKGIKGSHIKIGRYYNLLRQNSVKLINLVKKEINKGGFKFVFTGMRAGLLSRNLQTVIHCIKFYLALYKSSNKILSRNTIWEWFVSQDGIFDFSMQAYKRYYTSVVSYLAELYFTYADENFQELFLDHLQQKFEDQNKYLEIVNELLQSAYSNQSAKEKFQESGLITIFIDKCLQLIISSSENNNKHLPINLICDLWVNFPEQVQLENQTTDTILTLLKRLCREDQQLLRISTFAKMFYMLEILNNQDSPYAPILYKTLIFSLMENFSDNLIRQYILNNCTIIFEQSQNLSVIHLLKPMLKQTRLILEQEKTNFLLNTYDFEFFVTIGMHSTLDVKYAVSLLDLLGEIFMKDFRYASCAMIPFQLISSKFIQFKAVQDFLLIFFKYGLQQISEKHMSKKKLHSSVQAIMSQDQIEIQLEEKQVRDNVLKLLERIINFDNKQFNDQIQDILLQKNRIIQRKDHKSFKPFVMVLSLMGNATSMISLYNETQPLDTQDTQLMLYKSLNQSVATRHSRVMQDISKAKEQRRQMIMYQESQEQLIQKKIVNPARKNPQTIGIIQLTDQVPGERLQPQDYIVIINEDEKYQLNNLFGQYQRVLKHLFLINSGTGYRVKPQNFEMMKNNYRIIHQSEYFKLLRSQGVNNDMLTLKQFQELIKAYALIVNKSSSTDLKFKEYLYFFPQIATYIYNSPDKKQQEFPIVLQTYNLILFFRSYHLQQGSNLILFDEPDPGNGDREIIRLLNNQLANGDQVELPDGYQQINDKKINIKYAVPNFMNMNISQAVCLEILDQVLYDAFNTHILEPQIEFTEYERVKGIAKVPKKRDNLQHVPVYLNVSPEIKLQFSKQLNNYSSFNLEECAYLLDDILYSVEMGSRSLISKNKKLNAKPNPILTQRQQLIDTQKKVDKQKELARQERARILQHQLTESRLKRQQEEQAKSILLKQEWQKQREIEKERQDKLKKQEITKKQELLKWRQEKTQQQVNEDSQQSKFRSLSNRDVWRKEKLKIRQLLDQKQQQWQSAQKYSQEIDQQEHIQQKRRKKIQSQLLFKERQKREQQKELENQVYQFTNSPFTKILLNEYSEAISLLFQFFSKQGSTGLNYRENFINQQAFNVFTSQFNIWPGLITRDQSLSIFKRLVKYKEGEFSNLLNIQDFQFSLIRISLTASNKLMAQGNQNENYLKLIFNYMNLPKEHKAVLDLLQSIKNNQTVTRSMRDKLRIASNQFPSPVINFTSPRTTSNHNIFR